MSNLPEPADQRSLRVSDADRERVAEVLREAAGQGRITLDELDERLGSAYAARTYADLEIVTRDLPAPHPFMPPVAVAGGFSPDRIGGSPDVKFSVAIMSGARRAGPWIVPPAYVAFAMMGGVHLDLRHARFSGPAATIHAYALMGGIEIIVPEDIEVDVDRRASVRERARAVHSRLVAPWRGWQPRATGGIVALRHPCARAGL